MILHWGFSAHFLRRTGEIEDWQLLWVRLMMMNAKKYLLFTACTQISSRINRNPKNSFLWRLMMDFFKMFHWMMFTDQSEKSKRYLIHLLVNSTHLPVVRVTVRITASEAGQWFVAATGSLLRWKRGQKGGGQISSVVVKGKETECYNRAMEGLRVTSLKCMLCQLPGSQKAPLVGRRGAAVDGSSLGWIINGSVKRTAPLQLWAVPLACCSLLVAPLTGLINPWPGFALFRTPGSWRRSRAGSLILLGGSVFYD